MLKEYSFNWKMRVQTIFQYEKLLVALAPLYVIWFVDNHM